MNVTEIHAQQELPLNEFFVLYAGLSDQTAAKWFKRKYLCEPTHAYRWDNRLYIVMPEGCFIPQRNGRLR